MGLSMTLMGLNFRSGDRLVITNHEHNAIRSPLQVLEARVGVRVVTQAFPPAARLRQMNADELLDALFPDSAEIRGAKALCVSHVYPTSGVRLPLQVLRSKAEQLGIQYLVVDGAQALGMIDLTASADNVKYSDFYAGPGHKWLNGPPSTGVLFMRNEKIRPPEFYPTISQRMGKYLSHDGQADDAFPMAEALQVRGCSNAPGFAAMIRAVDHVDENGGAAQVEKHILGLSRLVKDFIHARAQHSLISPYSDDSLQSGLSSFFPFSWDRPEEIFTDRKTANHVVSELLKNNIQVRSIGFPNEGTEGNVYAIRVSTGFFNTVEQVGRFQKVLPNVLRNSLQRE
jgi:selenocysteine lyase/cysteine desulfurase